MNTSLRTLTACLFLIGSVSGWSQDVVEEGALDAPDEVEAAFERADSDGATADTAAENPLSVADPAISASPMTLSFQVHPIFPPDQAELVYRPLITYLESVTPHQFELMTARDFHRFWLEIRRGGRPDLVLEDAHLIALRMQRDGYLPLVKAAEPATFSLLTTSMAAEPQLDDFIARPVSSMPAPSLGYLVLSSWYSNPMQQPRILSNAGSWLDAVEIVFSMEAEAAIVPHNLVARYVNMASVRTSEAFPHATIASSPDVPADVREQLRIALLALHENGDHFTALHELDIDRFVPAQTSEYVGLERWLNSFSAF